MNLGVIFDMDGVLIDSVPGLWSGFKAALQEHNIDLPDEDLGIYRGMGWMDVLARWKQEYNLVLEPAPFIAKLRAAEFSASPDALRMPGVLPLVQTLHSNSIPIAVGTSSEKPRALNRLSRADLHHYFPIVVTADDVPQHKPAPDIFLEAARQMKVSPENCVVFEDSVAGVEAARRAGMKCIAFAPSANDHIFLQDATQIVTSYSQVDLNLIQSLLKNN